jgi:hypothetical protein
MGTDTFDERDLQEDTPPPRLVGHNTLFELVAKDCEMCEYKRICTEENSICRLLNKVNLRNELK